MVGGAGLLSKKSFLCKLVMHSQLYKLYIPDLTIIKYMSYHSHITCLCLYLLSHLKVEGVMVEKQLGKSKSGHQDWR